MSKDKEVEIREAVAENPETPTEVLVTLAKDEDIFVRDCAEMGLSNRKK